MALEWDGETVFELKGVQLKDTLSPVQSVHFKFNSNKNSLVAISTGIDPIIEIDAARLSRPYRLGELSEQAVISAVVHNPYLVPASLFQFGYIYKKCTYHVSNPEKTLGILVFHIHCRGRIFLSGNPR